MNVWQHKITFSLHSGAKERKKKDMQRLSSLYLRGVITFMYDTINVCVGLFDTLYIQPEISNSIIQKSSLRARCSVWKEHLVHMSCYLPKYQEVSNSLILCGRKKINFFWANTKNKILCKHFWVCSSPDLNICLVLPNTGTIIIVKWLICRICSHFNMGQYITQDCIRLALCTGSLSVGVT